MWGDTAATATLRRGSPTLHWPHMAYFPPALVNAAAIALQPGFGILAHVACEEVATDEPVLSVCRREGSDRAARAGPGILPRHAHVARARECLGGRRFGISKISFGRCRRCHCMAAGFAIPAKHRIELVAARPARECKHNDRAQLHQREEAAPA